MRVVLLALLWVSLLGFAHDAGSQNPNDLASLLERNRFVSEVQQSTILQALTSEQRSIALDPVSALEAIRELVPEHGEIASLLLILMPLGARFCSSIDHG